MITPTLYSLDALYRAHGRWLLGWLTVQSRCDIRASDLMQETFCRMADRPEIRLHSHPRRYLSTVARRLLIDDMRRRTVERCLLEALSAHRAGETQPGPDRIAEAVEELGQLVRLLDGLPKTTRRAFLLSRLDGLTYAEIGRELGVSASMVKQHMIRAIAHCYSIVHGRPD